jgi:two-component system sensor histidine kinase SenX3
VTTAIVAVAAGGAVLLAVVALLAVRHLRLVRVADEALGRLGGSPGRGRHRPAALLGAVERREEARSVEGQEAGRLAGALAAAGVGVIIVDGSGALVFANEAAGPFLHPRHGEMVAEEQVRRGIDLAIGQRQAVTREVHLYTPRRRALKLEVVPLESEGESLGAVAYITDVTDELRVEEMRRDFVANVGHELKTPLGALLVLAETLGEHPDEPAVTAGLTERLVGEARRLAHLVDDMLDLSQAEDPTPVLEPTRIAEVVADLIPWAEEQAARRGVRLVVDPVPEEAVVPGDHRRLGSMLMNLVDNAIKYSEPRAGGQLPSVWVRARVEGESVILEVQDEGIGIAEGHLDRIFERFYRVDRARSRATGGTGLGLSIVRHTALSHGGDVGVESRPGEGSIFRVRLPLWKQP